MLNKAALLGTCGTNLGKGGVKQLNGPYRIRRLISGKPSYEGKSDSQSSILEPHCKQCMLTTLRNKPVAGPSNLLSKRLANDDKGDDIENCDQPSWFKQASNYFELFGFDCATFEVPLEELKRRYHCLTFAVHPDRVNCKKSSAGYRRQLDCSEAVTILTEAYRCLKDPYERAIHMLRVQGIDVDETQPNAEFLVLMMEINELAETDLAAAQDKLRALKNECLDQLSNAFAKALHPEIVDKGGILSKLRFINRSILNCDNRNYN